MSAAWRHSSSPLSASLKPGIGRPSGPPPPLPLQSSPCGHTRYSLTHHLTVDISICMRYETSLNVVLDMQTICSMQRPVRMDGRTDKTQIEHASVGLAHVHTTFQNLHVCSFNTLIYHVTIGHVLTFSLS